MFLSKRSLKPPVKRWLLALGCLWMVVGSFGFAKSWTIQTIAFRDYRDAAQAATRLKRRGFNAYNEFSMHQGKQYARVRVGCFFARESAEVVANRLRQVTEEAVVVPLSEDASVSPCLRYDIGFLEPDDWGVMTKNPNLILFWVKLHGRQGYLAYNGRSWQILQSREEAVSLQGSTYLAGAVDVASPYIGAASSSALSATFTELPGGNLQATLASGSKFMVGHGKLLWHSEQTAVAQVGDMIVAISLFGTPR